MCFQYQCLYTCDHSSWGKIHYCEDLMNGDPNNCPGLYRGVMTSHGSCENCRAIDLEAERQSDISRSRSPTPPALSESHTNPRSREAFQTRMTSHATVSELQSNSKARDASQNHRDVPEVSEAQGTPKPRGFSRVASFFNLRVQPPTPPGSPTQKSSSKSWGASQTHIARLPAVKDPKDTSSPGGVSGPRMAVQSEVPKPTATSKLPSPPRSRSTTPAPLPEYMEKYRNLGAFANPTATPAPNTLKKKTELSKPNEKPELQTSNRKTEPSKPHQKPD